MYTIQGDLQLPIPFNGLKGLTRTARKKQKFPKFIEGILTVKALFSNGLMLAGTFILTYFIKIFMYFAVATNLLIIKKQRVFG